MMVEFPYPLFARIYPGLWVGVSMGMRPPDQPKNDTDLKFGTHTFLDHI